MEDYVVAAQSPILLVLDEIDQLDSKSQQVLYSVYELPHLTNSMLTLVGIANALDLTDRILPRLKVSLRSNSMMGVAETWLKEIKTLYIFEDPYG